MYFTIFAALLCLSTSSLGAPIPLPNSSGAFNSRQVWKSNRSTMSKYRRNSHKYFGNSAGAHRKRFYANYHNDAHTHEICAETNFVETSSLDSALYGDCEAIVTDLRANPGYFETGDYAGSGYNYLTTCGTCAFGVFRTDGLSERVDIGDKDVIDNINSALIRFDRDGHVGATGNFTCNSAPITWAILRAA
ncbi:hypothetical protein AAE478_001293 [Parahypoxylon ruwenzoriense]